MKVLEITEGVALVYGKKGNKVTKKYRCTSGSRKGRIVAKPSTCTAPKKIGAAQTLKKTRRSKGKTLDIKRSRTKRATSSSRRVATINKARKIKPTRRSSKRRRT
jgi:hypothetical protein